MDTKLKQDSTTTVAHLKEAVLSFINERHWNGNQRPRDLAISICLEAAELLELFQWRAENSLEELRETPKYQELKDELADVLIYCMSMSNSMNIDITESVREKLAKNSIKYPAPDEGAV